MGASCAGHSAPCGLRVPTPFGPLVASCADGRLRRVRFDAEIGVGDPDPGPEPGPVTAAGGSPPCPVLAAWAEQLDRYLQGGLHRFDLPLDWDRVHGLRRAVLEATVDIPPGTVSSYGALAARVGRPGQARAVGGALRSNPWVVVVPCHRVVAADGALTGYGGGPGRGGRLDRKAALLALEGRPSQGSLFDGEPAGR